MLGHILFYNVTYNYVGLWDYVGLCNLCFVPDCRTCTFARGKGGSGVKQILLQRKEIFLSEVHIKEQIIL